jgi:lipid II:glycine glycyltransferase (peptidoglycan interpeptide bridge formation enzyme)
MHQKTRYNIHLARRAGVEIHEAKDARVFWQLNRETTARDRFKSHDEAYYKKMLKQPNVHQLTAYHQDRPVAANIFMYFGDTLTYLHGASASRERGLMAPYLLQWDGMKLGKRLGAHWYDVWGIAPFVEKRATKNINCFHNRCWSAQHPWSGITRFKVGFGGEMRTYPQALDVIFKRPKYFLYAMSRRLRRIMPF